MSETGGVSQTGPVYLRWRPTGAPAPEMERFEDLDAALDAVEARWQTLRDQAPQILDVRRVLLLSTEQLRGEFESPPQS
ncbi:MAG TPA: hypothetical protein VGN83_08875 [Falsiroseomonas sp.]|jgi:hypothetical protein|nr:hypothetical protein [Falsiroseomonas sp.]